MEGVGADSVDFFSTKVTHCNDLDSTLSIDDSLHESSESCGDPGPNLHSALSISENIKANRESGGHTAGATNGQFKESKCIGEWDYSQDPHDSLFMIVKTAQGKLKFIGSVVYDHGSTFTVKSQKVEISPVGPDGDFNVAIGRFDKLVWHCAGKLKSPALRVYWSMGVVDSKLHPQLLRASGGEPEAVSCGLIGGSRPHSELVSALSCEMCFVCWFHDNSFQFALRPIGDEKGVHEIPGNVSEFRGSLKYSCGMLQAMAEGDSAADMSGLSILPASPLRYLQRSPSSKPGCNGASKFELCSGPWCCLSCAMSYRLLTGSLPVHSQTDNCDAVKNEVKTEEKKCVEPEFCAIRGGVLTSSKNFVLPQIDLASQDGSYYINSHLLLLTTDLFSCKPGIWVHAIVKYWHTKFRVFFVHLYEDSAALDETVTGYLSGLLSAEELFGSIGSSRLSSYESSRQWIFPSTCRHVLVSLGPPPAVGSNEAVVEAAETTSSDSACFSCACCGDAIEHVLGSPSVHAPAKGVCDKIVHEMSYAIDKGPEYTMGASTEDVFNSSMVTPISSIYITMRSLIPVHAAKNFVWPLSYPLDQISTVREFVQLLQGCWMCHSPPVAETAEENGFCEGAPRVCHWGLRCEKCKRSFHAKCVQPPNARIPPSDPQKCSNIKSECCAASRGHVPIFHWDEAQPRLPGGPADFSRWRCPECVDCAYCGLPLSEEILPDPSGDTSTCQAQPTHSKSGRHRGKASGAPGAEGEPNLTCVRCVSCNFSAHRACCNPSVPKLHFLSFWRCDSCRRCLGCGWQDRRACDYTNWDSHFFFCRRCNYLLGQHNYCAVCYGIWNPDGNNVPMAGTRHTLYSISTHGEAVSLSWIQCGGCGLWLHASCDSLEGADLKSMNSREVRYRCPICRSPNRQLRYYRILELLFLLDKNNKLRYKVPRSCALYWRLVKNPINLSQIKHRLEHSGYASDSEFVSDILLIPYNVKLMSMPNAKVYKLALNFEKKCRRLVSRMLLADDPNPPAHPPKNLLKESVGQGDARETGLEDVKRAEKGSGDEQESPAPGHQTAACASTPDPSASGSLGSAPMRLRPRRSSSSLSGAVAEVAEPALTSARLMALLRALIEKVVEPPHPGTASSATASFFGGGLAELILDAVFGDNAANAALPLKARLDSHFDSLFTRPRKVASAASMHGLPSWVDADACSICGSADRQSALVFCRICGSAAHAACLGVPLSQLGSRYQCANCAFCSGCGRPCNSNHPLDVSNLSDVAFAEQAGWVSPHMARLLSPLRLNGVGYLSPFAPCAQHSRPLKQGLAAALSGDFGEYLKLLYDSHVCCCAGPVPGALADVHSGPFRSIVCVICLAPFHPPCVARAERRVSLDLHADPSRLLSVLVQFGWDLKAFGDLLGLKAVQICNALRHAEHANASKPPGSGDGCVFAKLTQVRYSLGITNDFLDLVERRASSDSGAFPQSDAVLGAFVREISLNYCLKNFFNNFDFSNTHLDNIHHQFDHRQLRDNDTRLLLRDNDMEASRSGECPGDSSGVYKGALIEDSCTPSFYSHAPSFYSCTSLYYSRSEGKDYRRIAASLLDKPRIIGKRSKGLGMFSRCSLRQLAGTLHFSCPSHALGASTIDRCDRDCVVDSCVANANAKASVGDCVVKACCSYCSVPFVVASIPRDSKFGPFILGVASITLPLSHASLCPACAKLVCCQAPARPQDGRKIPDPDAVRKPHNLLPMNRLIMISHRFLYGLLHTVVSAIPTSIPINFLRHSNREDGRLAFCDIVIKAFIESDFFRPLLNIAVQLIISVYARPLSHGVYSQSNAPFTPADFGQGYSVIDSLFNSSLQQLSLAAAGSQPFAAKRAETEFLTQIYIAEHGGAGRYAAVGRIAPITKLIWIIYYQYVRFQKASAAARSFGSASLSVSSASQENTFNAVPEEAAELCELLGRSYQILLMKERLECAVDSQLTTRYMRPKLYFEYENGEKICHFCVLCGRQSLPGLLGNLIQFRARGRLPDASWLGENSGQTVSSIHGECLAWSIPYEYLTRSWNPVFNALITVQPLPEGTRFKECMFSPVALPPIEVPQRALEEVLAVSHATLCGVCGKKYASVPCYGNCGARYHLPCVYAGGLHSYYTGRKVWCYACWSGSRVYRLQQVEHLLRMSTEGVRECFVPCEGMSGGAALVVARQAAQRVRVVPACPAPMPAPSELLERGCSPFPALGGPAEAEEDGLMGEFGGVLVFRKLLDNVPFPVGHVSVRRWWHRFQEGRRTHYVFRTALTGGRMLFTIEDPLEGASFSHHNIVTALTNFASTFTCNLGFIGWLMKVGDASRLYSIAETLFGFNDPEVLRKNKQRYLRALRRRVARLLLPDQLAQSCSDCPPADEAVDPAESCENDVQVLFDSSESKSTEDSRVKKKFDTLNASMLYRYLQSLSQSSRLRVGESPIHGIGLFANELIQSGEPIIEYVGELIRDVVSDIRESLYTSKWGFDGSCYMFKLNDELVVDATRMGNMSRFINHSCEPNCACRIITCESGLKHIVIFAKRDIRAGEEITYNYQFGIEGETRKLSCHCGAPSCLGRMN